MTTPTHGRPPATRRLWRVAYAAAAVAGAWWGYDFGVQVGGGPMLGLVAALNAAAFAVLLVGGVAQWFGPPSGGRGGTR